MSYQASAALQGAIYGQLSNDPDLRAIVGDAIFDAMPVTAPSGIYIALGAEEMQDAGDISGPGSQHDLVISVISGAQDVGGFSAVKSAAAIVCRTLQDAADRGALDPGEAAHFVDLWFRRAKARRVDNGGGRRVDLTFRARLDLTMDEV